MADLPISGLPNSLPLTGSEKFPLVQAGSTVQASINDILALAAVPGATNGLQLISGNIGLGAPLTQNTNITGSFNLNLGTNANKLANLNSQISGTLNFVGNIFDFNTDNGVYNTPSFYLDPTNNYWDIGSSQAQFWAQLTQVNCEAQYFNVNATQIMQQLTPNRVLVLDASKFISSSSVTTTQLNVLTAFNANVIGSTLTGYVSGAGTISATDTLLSAIEKLNGNIGALVTGVSSVNSLTGAVPLTGTSNRITVSGTNQFDIAATYVGQPSITTLGTVTTGTWNATTISPAFGGTGVNNGTATISIAGNITFAGGSYTQNFTATGNTSVILPTTGKLATTSQHTISWANTTTNISAATTYYIGGNPSYAPLTSSNSSRRITVLKTGTITVASLQTASGNAQSESGFAFKINNVTTNTLVTFIASFAYSGGYYNGYGTGSLAVNQGDQIEIQVVTPNSFGTAPTGVAFTGWFLIE